LQIDLITPRGAYNMPPRMEVKNMKQYKLGDKVRVKPGLGINLADPIRFYRPKPTEILTGVVNRQIRHKVGLHINGLGMAVVSWDDLERL